VVNKNSITGKNMGKKVVIAGRIPGKEGFDTIYYCFIEVFMSGNVMIVCIRKPDSFFITHLV